MLSRAVLLSKHAKVYSKGFASSSKILKGIAIGGQASSSDTSPPRSFLAALKREVEESSPAGTQDDGKVLTQRQHRASIQTPTRQPRQSTIDDPLRIPRSSSSNNSKPRASSTPSSSTSMEEGARRRNPFALRNRLTTREDDEWGPGLRAKIEEAQKTEGKMQMNELGNGPLSNSSSFQENEQSNSDYAGSRSSIRRRNTKRSEKDTAMMMGKPEFREYHHGQVSGRWCTERGYENWQMWTKQIESGGTTNLLVRSVRMQSASLPLALTSISAALLKSNATPRTLLFRNFGRNKRETLLQVELGGYLKDDGARDRHPPESKFSFRGYPGIKAADSKAARMIDVILRMEAEFEEHIQKDNEGAIESKAKSLSQRSSSRTEDDATIGREIASRQTQSQDREEKSKGKTAAKQDDATTEKRIVSRQTQSPDREERSKGRTKAKQVDVQVERKDKVKASLSGWTTMYSSLYGSTGAANPSSESGVLVHPRGGSKEQTSILSRLTSMQSIQPPKGNNVQEPEAASSRLHIEESTPVYIDGEQAQDTAITSGSEHPIKMAQERQEGLAVDDGTIASEANSNDRIEDATPVFVDGEQANEKAIARDADNLDAKAGEGKSIKYEDISGESNKSLSTSEQESTPVHEVEQQATGTANSTDLVSPTSGARDAVKSANEERAEDTLASSGDFSISTEENIDESTPVHMDGTQVAGTTSRSGSEQSIELVRRRQADQESNFDGKVSDAIEDATPVFVDGEQAIDTVAQSSTHDHEDAIVESKESGKIDEILGNPVTSSNEPVEEFTPVFVDEQQANGAAITSGGEKATELASTRQDDEEVTVEAATTSKPSNDDPTPSHSSQSQRTEAASSASTSSARDAVKSANEGQVEEDQATKEESSTPVDESTPVHIDSTQAKGTASTLGADHPIDIAQKRQGEEHNEPDDEFTSSSKPIDDSVPVAVEGEQVGKKE